MGIRGFGNHVELTDSGKRKQVANKSLRPSGASPYVAEKFQGMPIKLIAIALREKFTGGRCLQFAMIPADHGSRNRQTAPNHD